MDITINQIKQLNNAERLIEEVRKKFIGIDENTTFMLEHISDELTINDVHLLMSLASNNESNRYALQKYFLSVIKKVAYLLTRKGGVALRILEDYTNGDASIDDVKRAVLMSWHETINNSSLINSGLLLNNVKITIEFYEKLAKNEAAYALFSLARIFVKLIGVQHFAHLDNQLHYSITTEYILEQAFSGIGQACAQALAFDSVSKIGIESLYIRTLNFETVEQSISAKLLCDKLRYVSANPANSI